MTYYENEKGKKHGHNKLKTMICSECLAEYTLGVDGTVLGCDRCQGITRNAKGMIIPDPSTEIFIHEEA